MLAASNALPRVVLLILLASSPSFAVMKIASVSRQQQLPGKAPQKTGAVQGMVRDANGRPVGGATATLRNLATGEIRKATANAEGVFRLVDVPAGEYELSIAGAGYDTLVEGNVTIAAGDSLTREIKLVAAAGATPPAQAGAEQLPPSTPSATGTESTAPGYSGAKQSPDLQPGAQPSSVPATFPPDGEVFQAEPNRWRVTMPEWNRYGTGGEHPYVHGSKWDPFDKNKWKGDVPVIGQQIFFNFTGIGDTFFDGRRLPVPSGVSTAQPGTPGFFGKGEQIFLDQLFIFSFDLFHGDAAFRPVDWRIRITPAVSMNYLAVRELGIVAVNVRDGTTRLDGHLGFQEMFGELKLHDIGPNFDFVSVRAGIQEFNADFRGFLFVDEQPGVRFFGNLDSNRWQYNLAYFNLLEKNTNSGLNTFERRKQQVIIANLYRQDFFFQGYTAQFSISYNDDQGGIHYDDNGFLVRPSPIGRVIFDNQIKTHDIHAAYLGWTGDGHIGRINLTNAFYQALGTDSFNPLAGRPVTINAQMAAVEASVDKDWIRFKGSLFYASGSANPESGHARGFDAIEDFPEFAGGIFSLWNREGIRLTGTDVGLTSPDSLLPSLRSDKDEGQANFVNPGIFLANLGTDFDLTPKLRGFVNVNYLRFMRTEPLELLLFQSPIHHSIGVDSSIGVRYRPPLTENISITAGAA
ncbi:MAG TPA: carboxypeptidase regulatory-like domain-containing protein, partial [Candidatus Acidoferrum sp.]|nr:carboxypeptidase regulatory-like domain-containing protein [Candidatus Acidoferrum sp.]